MAEDVFCLRQQVTVALIVASYFTISPHHLLMHNYQSCPFVSFTRAQYTKPMPCMCRVSIHSPITKVYFLSVFFRFVSKSRRAPNTDSGPAPWFFESWSEGIISICCHFASADAPRGVSVPRLKEKRHSVAFHFFRKQWLSVGSRCACCT